MEMYDIIIIGAGPAGISAGIYAVSRGMKTLIIEKDKVGGIIGRVSTVTHYAAIIENESGESFAKRMENQALSSGVKIIYDTVKEVSLSGPVKHVYTNTETYHAKRLILANGSTPRKLEIPGEKELAGRGIGLNASRDAEKYTGKNIYVIGGADGAVKEALYLSKFAKSLTIIHFEDSLGCISEFKDKIEKNGNISLRLSSRLKAVRGEDYVEELEIESVHDGKTEVIRDPGCGIFVYAGTVPNTELYKELELENGYILVNDKMETRIDGVYAAGDIRVKQVRQVATAVADGTIAAINAATDICTC